MGAPGDEAGDEYGDQERMGDRPAAREDAVIRQWFIDQVGELTADRHRDWRPASWQRPAREGRVRDVPEIREGEMAERKHTAG
nr:hypothetical protein [Natrinema caseinilyticum]